MDRPQASVVLLVTGLMRAGAAGADPSSADSISQEQRRFFESQVRLILSANCLMPPRRSSEGACVWIRSRPDAWRRHECDRTRKTRRECSFRRYATRRCKCRRTRSPDDESHRSWSGFAWGHRGQRMSRPNGGGSSRKVFSDDDRRYWAFSLSAMFPSQRRPRTNLASIRPSIDW
jgi:hypothetical protein